VHDKVVRRRRAVLGLLVLICLVLLTAYFGESQSSPLHSVQRGIVAVVSPIQDGASKVLSPVRNVSDWVSSTLRAKSQNTQLRRTNQQLTARLVTAQQAEIDNRQLQKEVGLDQNIGAAGYHPVGASVIVVDPNIWYQQVEVNKGSGDGVKAGDPVLGDGGLVGKVSEVSSSSAEVVLITDHTVSVAAEDQNVVGSGAAGSTGVLSPAVGNPDQLVLQDLPHQSSIAPGDFVVTAGFKDPSNPALPGSLYPPGIPIGRVAAFNQDELLNSGQVPVTPLASIRHLTSVQILTKPYAGSAEASVN
jgi:rod shape-determining protein MreC